MDASKPDIHRITRQRRVILEELRRVRTHPTADELYEMVREKMPRISLGTVYRNLDVLWKAGTILKLEGGGPPARFDGSVADHYHIRCLGCGRVDDVTEAPAGLLREPVGKLNNYEIVRCHVEFVGVCAECRRKRPAPSSHSRK